jgi:hypothetical protein
MEALLHQNPESLGSVGSLRKQEIEEQCSEMCQRYEAPTTRTLYCGFQPIGDTRSQLSIEMGSLQGQ